MLRLTQFLSTSTHGECTYIDIEIYWMSKTKKDSTCLALFPQKANLNETQVVATLVSLLFGIPGLSWDAPADHFECFAGEMEVTKAEWRVFWAETSHK